jgi:hypothetical protein
VDARWRGAALRHRPSHRPRQLRPAPTRLRGRKADRRPRHQSRASRRRYAASRAGRRDRESRCSPRSAPRSVPRPGRTPPARLRSREPGHRFASGLDRNWTELVRQDRSGEAGSPARRTRLETHLQRSACQPSKVAAPRPARRCRGRPSRSDGWLLRSGRGWPGRATGRRADVRHRVSCVDVPCAVGTVS